jgi:hypothetical protein
LAVCIGVLWSSTQSTSPQPDLTHDTAAPTSMLSCSRAMCPADAVRLCCRHLPSTPPTRRMAAASDTPWTVCSWRYACLSTASTTHRRLCKMSGGRLRGGMERNSAVGLAVFPTGGFPTSRQRPIVAASTSQSQHGLASGCRRVWALHPPNTTLAAFASAMRMTTVAYRVPRTTGQGYTTLLVSLQAHRLPAGRLTQLPTTRPQRTSCDRQGATRPSAV